MDPKQLQQILREQIPLTRAMGIEVAECQPLRIVLQAPLHNNINHKQTAFGGSLYSLAVLSGWCLLHVQLAQAREHGHIVIQQSQVSYLQPVSSRIVACCEADSDEVLSPFLQRYRKKHRARIALTSRIEHAGETALVFEGKYVVHG